MLMNILKNFDLAIANTETLPSGYQIENRTYNSYLSNQAWEAHLAEMSETHRCQYGDGSGGELTEKNGRPPKMASFASSSRMIYNLSKDVPGFVFEKQLPTVIGGVANLDGYLENGQNLIFVEAKCREPYSHTAIQTIKKNYKPVYAYLREKMPGVFSCVMEDIPDTRDMRVAFFCKGQAVAAFDMKQMICHLLGVANEMLRSGSEKAVLFLYLLFNPGQLRISPESKQEISGIYEQTCRTANSCHFEEMFGHILDFLVQKNGVAMEPLQLLRLKASFRFALCDQNDYKSYLGCRKEGPARK